MPVGAPAPQLTVLFVRVVGVLAAAVGVLAASLWPAAAQAHRLSSSTARAEAAYYAESLIERGLGSRYRVHSCRRHSRRAVSCGFRIYGSRGLRCGGRVRTVYPSDASADTVSRVLRDSCR